MLENVAYCPFLHTRLAEIKALQQLPAASKDRIFPIISARPWPNANELVRTWEKISEAFGERRFALDLDRTKFRSDSSKPAAVDFNLLFDEAGGYAIYYQLVSQLPAAVPVLRIWGGEARFLDEQLIHADAIDRGLVVRLEYGRVVNPLPIVQQVLSHTTDVAIAIDTGWWSNQLDVELWASQIIQQVSDLQPEIELIVSGSSFPSSFSSIVDKGAAPVHERALFNSLVRRHNAATLIYGDWGSTRPPQEAVPMRNVPRIDLPTAGEWISFRQDGGEGYADIARRTIADPAWPNELSIWGTYAIRCTAQNLPGAIRSPATAAAARINIHMHQQAHFGANEIVSDGDEPFTD